MVLLDQHEPEIGMSSARRKAKAEGTTKSLSEKRLVKLQGHDFGPQPIGTLIWPSCIGSAMVFKKKASQTTSVHPTL